MPDTIQLSFSTGHKHVDDSLAAIIGLMETLFQNAVLAYYLTGSYAYGDPVSTSDIDLCVTFRGDGPPGSERAGRRSNFLRLSDSDRAVLDHLITLCPIPLSFQNRSESRDRSVFMPQMSIERVFVYGEDYLGQMLRDGVSHEVPYTPADSMHRAYEILCQAHGVTELLTLPLTYPNPDHAFYGYADPAVDKLGRPSSETTYRLRCCAYEPSTALIALASNKQNWGRKDWVASNYRKYIHDDHTPFVEDFFHVCRKQWHYLIPEDVDDRARLRDICARALPYANHFMDAYKTRIIADLGSEDQAAVRKAVKQMGKVLLVDDGIQEALASASKQADADTQADIRKLLDRY